MIDRLQKYTFLSVKIGALEFIGKMEANLKKSLEDYFTKHKLVKYKKGEIIWKPGDKLSNVGYIKSGFVRMYIVNENGQEVTIQFFKPILYFSVIYAYTNSENRYYYEAITPTEVYLAPAAETLEFFKNNNPVIVGLMKNIMTAFLDLIDQFSFLLSGNAYNRVAGMVMALAERAEEGPNYSKIDFGITHKLIASLTGLTRETVTLQMIRLEEEGIIINKSKKVFVLSWDKLKRAAKSGV